MTTRTVLIVDDDSALCRILEEFLCSDGYEPVSAGTCARAVDSARLIQPGVALIDVNLPDGSGNGVLADLKRECPECICIMMTAYAEIDSVVAAFRNGAFHYLQKPIQPEALLRLVAAAFETVRLRKAEREAQQALRESEQRFRELAELLPLTVCEMDLEGRLTFMNRRAFERSGFAEEDFKAGISCFDLLAPGEVDRAHRNIERVLRGEDLGGVEYNVLPKDGTQAPAVIYAAPIHRQGALAGVRGVIVDITERKRAEEALRESQARQAEAEKLAATGRVAARVAHEINNPLAGIKNAFLLIKDAVPKDHPDHDLVGRIEKEIDRIARIVHQMYELHSPDKPAISAIAIDETVRDVVLMLEPACRQYEVRIEVHTEPADMTAAIPDGGYRQVLYNLLANAIEASSPEGAIKITTTLTDKKVRVSVSDQGDGIPSEVQDRVFEPFFTTKKDTTTGGIGLGLSIVQEIVDSLRGSIEFRSTPGKGTVFEVTLPA